MENNMMGIVDSPCIGIRKLKESNNSLYMLLYVVIYWQ